MRANWARPLVGALSTVAVISAGAIRVVGAVGATPAPVADCKHWSVAGTWNTATLPWHPVFNLTQDGETIGGTETFLPADAAGALFPNPTATVVGTLKGDQIDIIATFLGVLKAGKRPAGTLRAQYKGTIKEGSVSGSDQDISTPGGVGEWTGTGPAKCLDANRYVWSGSSTALVANGPRVLLPELPNGGTTSYRVISARLKTFGLFSTSIKDDKPISVQGKVIMTQVFRRVSSANNDPNDPVSKAPLTVNRTVTFNVSSGTSFAPHDPSSKRGGTLEAQATEELDTFSSACADGQAATLSIEDYGHSSSNDLNFKAVAKCMAGGSPQKGAATGDPLVLDARHFKQLSVLIQKRA